MADIYTEEYRPVPPFVEGNPSKLIIGTFPPASSKWDYPFFFPNRQNRLWNTLARVAEGKFLRRLPEDDSPDEAVALRKQLLRDLDAGMVNIILRCKRKNGSALDNDLTVLEMEDIVGAYIRPNSRITHVFLTSGSGSNSCLSLLRKHLRQERIPILPTANPSMDRAARLSNPQVFSIEIESREVKVYSLFSPSPTAMRSGITEELLFQQYQILRVHG